MMNPNGPQDECDLSFVNGLMMLKNLPRAQGIYSPSLLAGCERRLFFERTGKKKMQVRGITDQSSNAIFFDGDWRHLKWQFVLFQLHRDPQFDFQLIGCEIRVHNARRDFLGTLDALAVIGGEPFIIDIKGMRTNYFKAFVEGKDYRAYEWQISSYGLLLRDSMKGYRNCERGIILAEHKDGSSDRSNPIGIHERLVDFRDYWPLIRLRLNDLREYEETNTTPKPDCKTTTEPQFLRCPFRKYCRDEIAGSPRRD